MCRNPSRLFLIPETEMAILDDEPPRLRVFEGDGEGLFVNDTIGDVPVGGGTATTVASNDYDLDEIEIGWPVDDDVPSTAPSSPVGVVDPGVMGYSDSETTYETISLVAAGIGDATPKD